MLPTGTVSVAPWLLEHASQYRQDYHLPGEGPLRSDDLLGLGVFGFLFNLFDGFLLSLLHLLLGGGAGLGYFLFGLLGHFLEEQLLKLVKNTTSNIHRVRQRS